MTPEVRTTADYEECVERLTFQTGVEAADVIEDDPRADGPVVEAVIGPGYERVPPRVLRAITDCDLGVMEVKPQGVRPQNYYRVVVR